MRRGRIYRFALYLLSLAAVTWALFAGTRYIRELWQGLHQDTHGTVAASTLKSIQQIVRLNTLEVTKLVPIHKKWEGQEAFALGRYRAYISFDLERMETHLRGDTVVAVLPPEVIEIYEEEKDGFRVIDVWGTDIWARIQAKGLSAEQENEMRQMGVRAIKSLLYTEGLVKKARREALERSAELLGLLPGTVIIIDHPLSADETEKVFRTPHLEQGVPTLERE